MKPLLSMVLFSGLIFGGYSAVFFERQPEVSGHEDECYDKEENLFYRRGEEMKWRIKGCGQKICDGSNGKGSAYTRIHTCGKAAVPPGCYAEVDLDLPYPKCCERIVCPKPPELSFHLEQNLTE